jgi:hypothetical protein
MLATGSSFAVLPLPGAELLSPRLSALRGLSGSDEWSRFNSMNCLAEG